METRVNLRQNLESGLIDLRRYMRSMGCLTNRMDISSQELLNAANLPESVIQPDMAIHLGSVSDDLLPAINARGRARGRGRGRATGRGRARGRGRATATGLGRGRGRGVSTATNEGKSKFIK